MNTNTTTRLLLPGLALLAGLITASAQIAVPASFAHPKDQANTAKKGFRVRVVQANQGSGTLNNSVARAEAQLAGTLIDPATSQPYLNEADPALFGPDGYYNETAVIDYERGGGSTSGLTIPGIPGTGGHTDNIAMEVLTYLDLAAGTYTMGVNSDDGFRVTAGPDARDRFYALELGVYDAGRGAADSIFQFTIAQAGLYSFRLVWFQGGGSANVSWFMGEGDNKVLINDPNNAASIKAYRELTTPSQPYIGLLNPGVNATKVLPSTTINGTIVDGDTAQVVPTSVELFYDGAKVDANPQKTGNKTSYSYDPPGLLKPLSVHKVKLTFADTTGNVRTNEYQFTVAEFGNIALPTPFYFENFDSVPEGSLPAGWTVENLTDQLTPGEDLDDPLSDSYLNWVVISRERVISIGAANRWSASDRLSVLPGQFVNGIEVTDLVTGNFIYAESDQRGGTQVQYLFTPDINCSGKSNVFVSYRSIYTQNQDNIASVEYSIDGGMTWLPIVYMLDGPDIFKDASGNIDALKTLTNVVACCGDQPWYTDPATGERMGGYYGAYVGAASNLWPTLGPYISARVNDDQIESKRVELYRLPQADNQPKVRLRFAQAGTASWFFGIDDFGLYEIQQAIAPKITTQPLAQVASAGTSATFQVAATGTEPLAYQWKKDDNPISGATNATLTLSSLTAADAGDYNCIVSNAGGEAVSAKAHLDIFSGLISQDLVVHLKFDNDLNDASGRGNNGSSVGLVTFSQGKVGPNAVHISSGSDYVTLGAPADLNFGAATDFSVVFWARAVAWDGDPSFVGNKDWDSGGNQGWVIATDDDGHFQWNFAGPPGSRKDYDGPPGTFSDHEWHHIAVTFKRTGNAVSFVDGKQVDSRPLTANENNVNTPADMATNIGQDGTGTYGSAFTDLDVDDLGIWRRVLTPQEVAAIYAAGGQGKDLSTVVVGGAAELKIGSITLSGSNVTITWVGAPGVKLQRTLSLSPADWQDVPGTEGAASAIQSVTGTSAFYRLKK
jgi:hypothetical protein